MKRIHIAMLVVLLSTSLGSVAARSQPAAPELPVATPIGEQPGRQQFGAVVSGSIVVWEDRLVAPDSAPKSVFEPADRASGTSDIYGVDLTTNRHYVIANGPGDQTEPAISGTIVVWQDSSHSCPACEMDIHGKDLATGEEFAVATGPTDQTRPAVHGRTVIWLDHDDTTKRLVGLDLDTQERFEITAAPLGTAIRSSVMSAEYIVWAEGRAAPYELRAFNRATREVQSIGAFTTPETNYAISGNHLAWNDPQLQVSDLSTGTTTTIVEEAVLSPTIANDTVFWSAAGPDGLDLFRVDLTGGTPMPVVIDPGIQRHALMAGEWLVWSSDENGRQRILKTPWVQAFAAGPEFRQIRQANLGTNHNAPSPDETSTDSGESIRVPMSHDTSYTRPTHKGMHVAIGTGWKVTYNGSQQTCNATSCPAVDALGAPYAPFFGSFHILNGDLTQETGRDTPMSGTNTKAADWMKYYQNTYGSRVIVRTWPTIRPKPSGQSAPNSPADVANQIINLASTYDWIKHVQVNNEPNLVDEWLDSCESVDCVWVTNGQTRQFRWTDMWDDRKYQAINQFYIDAWYIVDYYRYNHSNSTVRTRLQAMELWTPPMSDIYDVVDTGVLFYNYLQNMIDLYDRLTYHTYPTPYDDANIFSETGLSGIGIVNNSWRKGFNTWLKGEINAGRVRSIITEFGWNPVRMSDTTSPETCNKKQHLPWYSSNTECPAEDGNTHYFQNDLDWFLKNDRQKAEVVAVWLVKGWQDPLDPVGAESRADGITATGTVRTWLHSYQWSNP